MEPHGFSRWRHGCSRIAPVSPWRHPGGDTVAPGVFPVYHGIWQPSRLLPVSPGCFKHFKTTGDMSRFNTVLCGSSRISKVVHGAATVVTRFIPDHQTGMNRHLKPGQWEWGLRYSIHTTIIIITWIFLTTELAALLICSLFKDVNLTHLHIVQCEKDTVTIFNSVFLHFHISNTFTASSCNHHLQHYQKAFCKYLNKALLL